MAENPLIRQWSRSHCFVSCSFQEVSIFIFEKKTAEKLHKPKRKETVTEILRGSVRQLERFRHPKILQVLHPVEECNETLAFASEPVLASLANVLAYQEGGGGGPPATGASQQVPQTRPAHAREYNFLDIEFKYGLLQVRCFVFIFSSLMFSSLTLSFSTQYISLILTRRWFCFRTAIHP